ncbi:MAG TPA: hypothetical protein VNH11_00035 [Pirellulales bacterium]|nr:hypothetical protein [Pirellulales bacterium]
MLIFFLGYSTRQGPIAEARGRPLQHGCILGALVAQPVNQHSPAQGPDVADCAGRCVQRPKTGQAGLVNSRRLGAADEQILENIVGLTPEDLRAAWDYYREHPAEIDNDIRVNEAD